MENRISDLDIIAKVRCGDDDSYKEIIRRYKSSVSATVFGILGNTYEAEDVGQEVFIRFYNSIGNFRGDSSLGTYITRIAINLSFNELKRKKRREWFSFSDKTENETGPVIEDIRDRIEMKEIVQKAMQKLPEKNHEVIVLRILNGYSTDETAKILNIPQGTVLSRLARGEKKLKELLTPYLEMKK